MNGMGLFSRSAKAAFSKDVAGEGVLRWIRVNVDMASLLKRSDLIQRIDWFLVQIAVVSCHLALIAQRHYACVT